MEFLPKELLLLSAALGFLGHFIKQASLIKNEFIPFVLIALGVVGSIATLGFSAESVLLGVVSASVAVTAKNMQKQAVKIKDKKKVEKE